MLDILSAIIASKVSGGGSGSSGGGTDALIVKVTTDAVSGERSADTSFEEIDLAYNTGRRISVLLDILEQDGRVFSTPYNECLGYKIDGYENENGDFVQLVGLIFKAYINIGDLDGGYLVIWQDGRVNIVPNKELMHGELYINNSGFFMYSLSGKMFRITVDDSGNLKATEVK